MSTYLLSIVGIVLIGGILSAIMPEGKTAAVIKGTAKLCCLIVILSPVLKFFETLKKGGDFSIFSSQTVIQTDASFIDYCSKERIERAETLLKERIEEKFSVEISVRLIWKYEKTEEISRSEEIKIERAELSVSGEEISLPKREEIEQYLADEYGISEAVFIDERAAKISIDRQFQTQRFTVAVLLGTPLVGGGMANFLCGRFE